MFILVIAAIGACGRPGTCPAQGRGIQQRIDSWIGAAGALHERAVWQHDACGVANAAIRIAGAKFSVFVQPLPLGATRGSMYRRPDHR